MKNQGQFKAQDITNQKFGRMTALYLDGKNPRGRSLWMCKCDCGNEKHAIIAGLRNGSIKSCGCFRRDQARTRAEKSKHTEFKEKACKDCGEKDPSKFFCKKGTFVLMPRCKKCTHNRRVETGQQQRGIEARRAKENGDPELKKEILKKARRQVIERKYGLTPEKEAELLDMQKHKCPACKRKFSDKIKMHRDHDHTLLHFRGFLCYNCNFILGHAESTGDPETTLINLLSRVRESALFNTARRDS